MFRHLLRYVRDEKWLLLLKHLRRRTNARNPGASLDRGRVHFSIELQHMQSFSVTVQDPEVGSMDAASAGQNAAQAVQDGLYRGLIGQSAGHIQQSSVAIFGARHSDGGSSQVGTEYLDP